MTAASASERRIRGLRPSSPPLRLWSAMTPLERERELLRKAEIAAHNFGTAFYPYTQALALARAARGPGWSAGWLRPVGAPEPPLAAEEESRAPPPSDSSVATGYGLRARGRHEQEHRTRAPPRVPPAIAAAVKRRQSPRAMVSSSRSSNSSSSPRHPPPPPRLQQQSKAAEEGVPATEPDAQSASAIEEGVPPEESLGSEGRTAAAS